MRPDRRRAARRLGGAAAEAGSVPDAASASGAVGGAVAAGWPASDWLTRRPPPVLHVEAFSIRSRPARRGVHPSHLRLPCIHS